MKFCRSCGTALAAPTGTLPGGGAPAAGGAMGMVGGAPMMPPPSAPPPFGAPSASPYGAPAAAPYGGAGASPYGGPSSGGPVTGGPSMGGPSSGGPGMGGPSMGGPIGGGPSMGGPMSGGPSIGGPSVGGPSASASGPSGGAISSGSIGGGAVSGSIGGSPGSAPPITAPGMMPPGSSSSPKIVPPAANMITCPRCGTPTPVGFAYCQQCGLHMQGLQPTDPGTPRAHSPSQGGTAPGGRAIPASLANVPVDPQGATLATDGPRPGSIATPAGRAAPAQGIAWGTAVLVNRDGTDGQHFPLAGEYIVVGRAGADIAFEDDRFLARQHARIERMGDGVKVQSLDALNGVFKKADLPVDLVDGMTILVGREVLRFENVDPEETKVHPLIRHGVALFGSPPREPWGRFVQIIPSGGWRDVRHLAGDEVVLGREEGDIVYRDDAFMSRRHAAVTWDGKKAQITDLGSSNGTFVRITGPTPIKHGDHVRMGDQLLRIELAR